MPDREKLMRRRPTSEEVRVRAERLRILRAARDGRMRTNEHGRYIIDGEKKRPDRKVREALIREGFITWPSYKDPRHQVQYLGGDAEIARLEALLGDGRSPDA